MSDLQQEALEQLAKTPEIRMSSHRSGGRHAWFPQASQVKLDLRTFDALRRKGLIVVIPESDERSDWRWSKWVPAGEGKENPPATHTNYNTGEPCFCDADRGLQDIPGPCFDDPEPTTGSSPENGSG